MNPPKRTLIQCLILLLQLGNLTVHHAVAEAPYAPRAGEPGTTAIHKGDTRFTGWASEVAEVVWGAHVDVVWRTPENALGPAIGGVDSGVVSLGEGGVITLTFEQPLAAGSGWDFAVFGNAFNYEFLELATVSVSSDGEQFVVFPHVSLTPGPVGAFGVVDSRQVDGFAGKYEAGYGVPFDLHDLAGQPGLDIHRVTHVRITDVIGNGEQSDSLGNPIYDPYPTVGSAGFDLDAVGVREPLAHALPGNHNLGLGWRWHPAFGYLHAAHFPWIHLRAAGEWFYHIPAGNGVHYLHHSTHGWMWTSDVIHPYAQILGTGEWVWLLSPSVD